MAELLQQISAGLANGCIYASLALALVMIYQSTRHINFAQGEMATFSTFIAWALLQAGWPYWGAFAATVAGSFAGGVLVQRVVLRRFDDAPPLAHVVVSVGLMVVFNALSGWLFDHRVRAFPSPFAVHGALATRWFSAHQVGSAAVLLAMLAALAAFFRLTPTGLALRAAALNPESARLVGVRVARLVAIGWGLAAAIGAVAGMLVAPVLYLEPNMMGGVLLYGFAAALLGGITQPLGAVVGGLLVGVAENLLGAYVIGTELKLSVALALIVGVLTVKPSGLFGRPAPTRV